MEATVPDRSSLAEKVTKYSNSQVLVTSVLALLAVGLLLVLIQWMSAVLAPIILAVYLLALVLPLFNFFRRRGAGKGIGLLIVVAVLVLGGFALGLFALYSLHALQTDLALYSEGIRDQLSGLELPAPVDADLAVATLGALIVAGIAIAGTFLTSVLIVAFFLLESKRFSGLLRNQLAHRPFLGMMPQLLQTSVRYFGIRTRLNLLTGAGIGILLFFLGIDDALLWAIWVFVLSYVPWIGLVVAGVPPFLLALAEFGVGRALLVVLIFAAVNITIENVVEPSYTGKMLKLSPTVVFLSFFFWAWLLGPVGAILSMPITVMLMLVFSRYENTRWIAAVIGRQTDEQAPAADAVSETA